MMTTGKTGGLECTLKRSNRKTMGIFIERDGTILIRAPHQTKLDDIEKFVSEKRIWIYQKLAVKKTLNRQKPNREFVNGQGFLYLGKSYRLKLVKNAEIKSEKSAEATPLRLWHGYFELIESERANARNHFILWYKKQINKQIKARMPRYEKRIGVTIKDVRISDLGHRWASCNRNGVISFNWRSVMAPVWVFDYILVHEMAHLIERGHTGRFWRLISCIIPDYEKHALWLNENGPDLDL